MKSVEVNEMILLELYGCRIDFYYPRSLTSVNLIRKVKRNDKGWGAILMSVSNSFKVSFRVVRPHKGESLNQPLKMLPEQASNLQPGG